MSITSFFRWIRKIRKRFWQTDVVRGHFPNTIYEDDVYVVSYPKSGNTWVRLLLTELLSEGGGLKKHHEVVPDLYRVEKAFLETMQRPRFMKTHEPFFREMPRCLYVVRDGRDVMVSYFHYLQGFDPDIDDFSTFIREKATWLTYWDQHVRLALQEHRRRPDSFLIVRYEDLISDDVAELKRITRFCEVEASDKKMKEAAEGCRFENLQQKEEKFGHPDGHNEECESGVEQNRCL